ncbi:hypothetical protein A1O3_09036 [Capronia epimyces CBS 606.96]|uniref:Uncharacterized protein n=1 Tax=Capronia epimyces CBS 606.96 TaxID=1182542 RepID=W9XBP0_9EURO|nr:uncharacterized protein A1O3_09036 [Capronia epimyces CBS 606.96]EXJ77877.1 hypothetical protein A1O3_09036 [Capronia epimyces CBS 606.96]
MSRRPEPDYDLTEREYDPEERQREREERLKERRDKKEEERDRRRDLEPDYEDVPFDKYRTENVQDRYHEYYPRRGDSPELRKYLETERSLVSNPASRRDENEAERSYVTRDNKQAHRERRDSQVSMKDMAYSRGHPLYDGYKSYRAKRAPPRDEQQGSSGGADSPESSRR